MFPIHPQTVSLSCVILSEYCSICPNEDTAGQSFQQQVFTNLAVHCPAAGISRTSCDLRKNTSSNDSREPDTNSPGSDQIPRNSVTATENEKNETGVKIFVWLMVAVVFGLTIRAICKFFCGNDETEHSLKSPDEKDDSETLAPGSEHDDELAGAVLT